MITFVISDDKIFRKLKIDSIVKEYSQSEIITFDDLHGEILDLEQYFFPSLFSGNNPIVLVKYLIGGNNLTMDNIFLKKMLMSPTIFIFEEMTLARSIITSLKKNGVIIHENIIEKPSKKEDNIFNEIKLLFDKDKKIRWLSYQDIVKKYPIEAIIGLTYWKIKDLISKSKGSQKEKYKILYKDLLNAHTKSWEKGAKLDFLIEKVILLF